MLRVYLVLFLEQYKLAIPILLISVYTASKGIKTLGRINEIIFYASIPLILLTVVALKQGNILNIKPILGTPISSILKASIEPVYSFVGIEIIFLIVPLMKDKTKIKNSFLKATGIIVFLYIWLSFVSIYYLGADIAKNLYWPTLSLAETIAIPGISNFKFVFMFLWSSIIFKTIANQNYFFYYSLSSVLKKIDPNILCLLVFVFTTIIVSRLDSFILLKKINKGISLFYLIFNLIFITSITIITLIKNGGKNEKIMKKLKNNRINIIILIIIILNIYYYDPNIKYAEELDIPAGIGYDFQTKIDSIRYYQIPISAYIFNPNETATSTVHEGKGETLLKNSSR